MELAKDASKELAKDATKELVKDGSKGGKDGKKSKTDSKKKVSSVVKVDYVEPATEVKVDEVAPVEAKVEPSGVKEMAKSSTTKPSAAKDVPIIPSAAKVEMAKSSTTKPSAAKEMPTIPSTAKVEEMPTPSAAKMEMPKPSTAKPSAAEPIIPSTAKVEMPTPSTAKIEMPKPSTAKPVAAKEMPDTPPVVSSLTKPSQTSVSSVQPHVEEDEVVILKETVSKKFGEMTFSDYNSAEDMDFCLSEADMDDTD